MKKLRSILAGALLLGTLAAFAQDSVKVTDDAAKDREGPGVGAQPRDQSEDYRRDMTIIQSSEIPENLRSTLQGEQYKGWENNAKIYRSRDNDSFIVEMKEGDQTRVHRFDQNGKPVKDY